MDTIRKTQSTIDDATEFLTKLYGADKASLWYRPYEDDELYTDIEPDYRQILKKKYADGMREIKKADQSIKQLESKVESVEKSLDTTMDLEKRTPLLERKVDLTKEINVLKTRQMEVADTLIQLDADMIQRAFDEHDKVVSVKRNVIGKQMFQQVWNEKIMNAYEKDKLQYLTSEEKERYFKEKVRDLKKFDKHGVLNHPDWFFRVVVTDFVVKEMHRLVYWFKNCSWDDFETIYKIVRKLRLLQLDVDAAWGNDDFNINYTNLFYISDDDAREFTKIDGILTGNTLYELFQSEVRLSFIQVDDNVGGSSEEQLTQ